MQEKKFGEPILTNFGHIEVATWKFVVHKSFETMTFVQIEQIDQF